MTNADKARELYIKNSLYNDKKILRRKTLLLISMPEDLYQLQNNKKYKRNA
jgi:hypothetical protein